MDSGVLLELKRNLLLRAVGEGHGEGPKENGEQRGVSPLEPSIS